MSEMPRSCAIHENAVGVWKTIQLQGMSLSACNSAKLLDWARRYLGFLDAEERGQWTLANGRAGRWDRNRCSRSFSILPTTSPERPRMKNPDRNVC